MGLLVLDATLDSYWSALPLIIAPWAFTQMHRMRHMETTYLHIETFVYFAVFSVLYGIGSVCNK